MSLLNATIIGIHVGKVINYNPFFAVVYCHKIYRIDT